MSALSHLFSKQGYYIEQELSVSPVSTRISMHRDGTSYMVDVTPERSLLLSVGDCPGWQKALAAARKICTQYMHAEPICRYDAKPSIVWTHFMEWELVCPRERLRTLVNRGEELTQIPFRDLRLYGEYCFSDFEDAALRQAYSDAANLGKQHPGVFGKDPGRCCDVLRILRADEFGLFLEYNLLMLMRKDQEQYRQTMRATDNAFAKLLHGATIEEIYAKETALALDFVAAQVCAKVGIKILAQPSKDHRLRFDEATFMHWFNSHSQHLTSTCPDDATLGKVFERYQRGEDVSQYAPQ